MGISLYVECLLGYMSRNQNLGKGTFMTVKTFWKDPYQTRLLSEVIRIEGHQIELSDTIFYAESGGQESDAGTMAQIIVTEAIKHDQVITYTLAAKPHFKVGDQIETCIDWARRYALMKLHFAAEVVLELFTQKYPEMTKVGAHISQGKSRIDFEWPESINALLPDIQKQAQALIDADSVIESDFSDETAEIRYWKLDDFAQVPCGGTHLKRTSEVGLIKLKRKNIGKGKERVEISLA